MLTGNLIIKDWRNIDLSFGLIYPNIPKIGMSSYSIRLLYNLINSYDNIVCERFFLPKNISFPASKDFSINNQLLSIENNISPQEFDVLGFSIQFENDFRNILWILEKAGINIGKREEYGNPCDLCCTIFSRSDCVKVIKNHFDKLEKQALIKAVEYLKDKSREVV